ncbi:MAG: His/Gly/Thr/Pro-type tRNA ligase C-terminal domain-containing protein [Candidatus Paceibacterota bacterium]
MKYSPTEFVKTATDTAEHFGFRTADSFRKDPLCKNCRKSLPHNITEDDLKTNSHYGLLSNAINSFCDNNLYALESPVLLYSFNQTPNQNETSVSFNIFNVQKSIAEAILIQVARSIMKELGHDSHTIRINSLGDSESILRYHRELTNFLKKRLDIMPSNAREAMKIHPLEALIKLIEEDHELSYKCPNPLEFLNDQSRKHFRDIIEYLDMTETPYEIDPKMITNYDCYSDALFSITDDSIEYIDDPSLSAHGGRYDSFVFSKTKSRIPAAGTVITLKNNGKTPSRIPRMKNSKPDVYVIQLGFGAKIRSLMVIDELRRVGVPVQHNLSSDSLSAQLREAESRGVRYAIIIGQKEFIEQTVILRDLKEQNQENISPEQMVRKLKKQVAVA